MAIERDDQEFIDRDLKATRVTVVGGTGGGGLTNAELRAAPVPVSGPLTDVQLRATAVPVTLPTTQLTTTITRLTGGADLNIAAGARSYTITVISAASAASPTLDGVALPVGYSATFTAPGEHTLEAAAILTAPGDDAIVLVIV